MELQVRVRDYGIEVVGDIGEVVRESDDRVRIVRADTTIAGVKPSRKIVDHRPQKSVR